MKHRIVIFQAEGGTDKWIDGHRKDTVPIQDALKNIGWSSEIIYFRDEWSETIFNYCKDKFDGYISRINPGNLANGEGKYFQILRKLSDEGLKGMSHPDVMINFGSKDALVKLAGTSLVPEDTYSYYDIASFRESFPITLSYGQRVLKQNRGSTGNGIWRVQIADQLVYKKGDALPLNTRLKCTEAVDNHVEYFVLQNFLTFCQKYIVGENGMLVDMKFLPRIKQGEIRIMMVGDKPIFVVHKKPADTEDAFSATLFSGAKYVYDSPEKWSTLITLFRKMLPTISEKLGGFQDRPLIWTADFILDNDSDGNDLYILGEINCSCVGFTSHLEYGIQECIANEVVRRITPNKEQQLI